MSPVRVNLEPMSTAPQKRDVISERISAAQAGFGHAGARPIFVPAGACPPGISPRLASASVVFEPLADAASTSSITPSASARI